MEITVLIQNKHQPPALESFSKNLLDFTANPNMTMCLVEGIGGADPTVLILSPTEEGTVAMRTNLTNLLKAVGRMAGAAETRWNWERPEDSSFMARERAVREAAAKSLKNALDEWVEHGQ